MSAGASSMTPQQLNAAQRAAVLAASVEMNQQIFSQTIATLPTNPVFTVIPRNVGLVKKFIVEITGTATNSGGGTSKVSQLGLANLLSQVVFTDLNNNVRIQTNGFHLAALSMAKKRRPAEQQFTTGVTPAAAADTNQMLQVGENFPILAYAAPGEGDNTPFRAVYEIPLAYSDNDLRGAVYMNVVNATALLQLYINPNAMVGVGTDSTFAMFGGNTGNTDGGVLSDVTCTVYQVYLDQIPVGKNGPILPTLDLSTVYELKQTNFSAITAGMDFPIPYANFRDFVSTFAVYNGTGADGGLSNGGDINYWALQSANFTNLWKRDPLEIARDARNEIGVDFPKGVYYFPSRKKPISTTQYGNMELILNASTADSGAYCTIFWEDFALVNTLTAAGSLAAS